MLRTRSVLLVHGINSWGSWYDTANDVLGRDFHCRFHRYEGYRRLGFLRVITSLRGLALATLSAIAVVLAYWTGVLPGPTAILLASVSVCLSVFYGVRHAIRRRDQCIHELANEIERIEQVDRDRPHIIAHSYGTYLTSRVLEDYMQQDVDVVSHGVECVIFWGSVVDSKYPWDALVRCRRARFVRNDVGRRDCVVTLVRWGQRLSLGLLYRLVPGLGDAGLASFEALSVRNAPFNFNHSTALENKYTAIARYYWLPCLWGLDPEQHARFCSELTETGKRVHAPGSRGMQEYDALLDMPFDWTIRHGQRSTLGEFISELHRQFQSAKSLPPFTGTNLLRFQRAVCDYVYAVSSNRDIRVIDPPTLVGKSVERILAKYNRRFHYKT